MNINSVNSPNFGMAIRYKDYHAVQNRIFRTFSPINSEKFTSIEYSQRNNPVNVFLDVEKNFLGQERLVAKSGEKTYKENIFNSGISVIKSAVKNAQKQYMKNKNV